MCVVVVVVVVMEPTDRRGGGGGETVTKPLTLCNPAQLFLSCSGGGDRESGVAGVIGKVCWMAVPMVVVVVA